MMASKVNKRRVMSHLGTISVFLKDFNCFDGHMCGQILCKSGLGLATYQDLQEIYRFVTPGQF